MIDQCYIGDCRDGLRKMIAEGINVQCCVTSPPYWNLRDYGVADQIGLEKTMPEFIAAMVEVFGLVWDVLADDGVCWINMGDCMLPNKCEAMVPHRLVLALIDYGWICRQTIIWAPHAGKRSRSMHQGARICFHAY
jgi:DNA modification methylase